MVSSTPVAARLYSRTPRQLAGAVATIFFFSAAAVVHFEAVLVGPLDATLGHDDARARRLTIPGGIPYRVSTENGLKVISAAANDTQHNFNKVLACPRREFRARGVK